MNDSLVRRIISVGDLFERFLINEIKLKHFDGDKGESIRSDNSAIWTAIIEMVDDVSVFDEEKSNLARVLQDQWDMLDSVHDDNLSMEDRGKFAVLAQKINEDRMMYKNQINNKSGSSIELKSYGVK